MGTNAKEAQAPDYLAEAPGWQLWIALELRRPDVVYRQIKM
jgi:hypothetical protein